VSLDDVSRRFVVKKTGLDPQPVYSLTAVPGAGSRTPGCLSRPPERGLFSGNVAPAGQVVFGLLTLGLVNVGMCRPYPSHAPQLAAGSLTWLGLVNVGM
jgi:hypothetical protein